MTPPDPFTPGRRPRRRGRRLRRAAGLVSSLAVLAAPAVPALAQAGGSGASDPSQSGAPSLGAVLVDERLSPALAGVEVEGAGYARAYDAWAGTQRELADAERTATRTRSVLAGLEAERVASRAALEERRLLRRSAVYDLDGLDVAMSQLAVASYMRGGPTAEAAKMFDVGDVTDELYAQTLEREVANDQVRRRATVRDEITRLERELAEITSRLGDLADRAFEAAGVIEENRRRADDLRGRLPALEAALRDARLTGVVVGSDLQLVALDAYLRAAGVLGAEKPSCALEWPMIAALGRIESRHGNINGATLRPDGRTTIRILGIALTGESGTALVPDSDDGRLDGDAELDRAVGPMQFIPTTWAIHRRDGNGDKVSDPQNMYDAALATATFLCSSGRSLADVANLRSAYLAYNRSTTYVTTAVANVERYRAVAFPPPRPVS